LSVEGDEGDAYDSVPKRVVSVVGALLGWFTLRAS
jgi:hypothetical protein